jgi:magnesium chelatase family protein
MLAQPFAGLLRPMTVEEALQGKEIDTHTALDDAAAAKFLNIAAARLGWSALPIGR